VLLLTQAEQPKRERRVIPLAEMTCKAFTELPKQEQGIIMAWLQGYDLPEDQPAVIDLDRLLSDRAKLSEYCIDKPEDDVMTAAEAVLGRRDNTRPKNGTRDGGRPETILSLHTLRDDAVHRSSADLQLSRGSPLAPALKP
jgi:hypothetical protein